MNLKQSFLLLFFLTSFSVNHAVMPIELDTVKSYVMPIKKFAEDNKKSLKRIAKAGAAAWLLKGYSHVMWDQVTILNRKDYKSIYDVAHAIYFPEYESRHVAKDISSPPYLTALGISAYLLEPRLYKKVGTWIKERFILNDRALEFIKNLAKVGGALLLLKGNYHLAHDQIAIINPKNTLTKSLKQLIFPTKKNGYDDSIKLSRPPHIPALGIAAYFLYSGGSGICKEMRNVVAEYKNKNNQNK